MRPLGLQTCPLDQQLAVDRRQKISQSFYIAAVLLQFSVKLRIGPFCREWLYAQLRASARQFR